MIFRQDVSCSLLPVLSHLSICAAALLWAPAETFCRLFSLSNTIVSSLALPLTPSSFFLFECRKLYVVQCLQLHYLLLHLTLQFPRAACPLFFIALRPYFLAQRPLYINTFLLAGRLCASLMLGKLACGFPPRTLRRISEKSSLSFFVFSLRSIGASAFVGPSCRATVLGFTWLQRRKRLSRLLIDHPSSH